MRVLIAVTHLLGAGHLTRAAALARGFARAGHDVTLVSGGSPAPLVRLDGVRLVQLPPLRVTGTAFSRPLGADGLPAGADLLDERRAMLRDALDEAAPDAVLTELFPFGRRALAAEFLALTEAARARRPRPVVIASVRDILVAPERSERVALAHARVAALYDAVLVHADPGLVPLDASWPLDAATRAKVTYTGYIDEGATADPDSDPSRGRAGVLVAAGSSAAGLGLYRAAAEAARRRPDLGWRILVGHGVPDADFAALGHGLGEGVLARARPDYRALLAGAAVSVSQCGYNTAVDLLAAGTPSVLVPFEAGHETEQRLRAERLAARGLGLVVPEREVRADVLLRAIHEARAGVRAGPHGIDLGGVARTVALVEGMADHRDTIPRDGARTLGWNPDEAQSPIPTRERGPRVPTGAPAVTYHGIARDLDRLRAALDRACEAGIRVPLWWRDDDAVAATPALDRLLRLAEAHAAPLLVAAIPARVEPSLAHRLAGASAVSLAVHGLAHENHAPHGHKPAEFGEHRSLPALVADAAAALVLARERLPPERLLPVFVPPWNRLSAALAAALPGLGYAGLSAAPGAPVAGLVRADAGLDPIDWRGTRSLRDPAAVIGVLIAHVEAGSGRPLGLLTHHLAHDEAVWDFLGALLPALLRHPAVELRDPRRLFGAAVDAGVSGPSSQVLQRARTG